MTENEVNIYNLLCNLKVGDKLYGWNEKKPYKVLFVNERYTLISKPQFGEYMYSVIDKKLKIMGRCDKYWFGSLVPKEVFQIGVIEEPFQKYIMECESEWNDKELATVVLYGCEVSIFSDFLNFHL